MPGLGDEFRVAREARHLSLSDVSDQIHIRSIYLEAIEKDDPSFAAPVYVKGFIRTYARFLGLDSEAAVAQFNATAATSGTKPHEPVSVSSLPARRKPTPWLGVAALAAILLVVFVGYKYFEFQQKDGGASATVAVASAAPSGMASGVATAAPTPKATASPKQTLEVRVTADSWMSVKIDGAGVLEGIVKAGTVKNFHGKNAVVRAGNAGGVDLTVNGKALGKMGNSGDVVERRVTLTEE